MRKMAFLLAALFAASMLTGCVMPYTSPVYGGLVTSDVMGPVSVGDVNVPCTKKGTAEAEGIVFFANGDASIQKAMEEGEITKIHHVDCKVFSVLGLYTKYTTIVYGE